MRFPEIAPGMIREIRPHVPSTPVVKARALTDVLSHVILIN